MTDRKQLLGISELHLADRLEHMDDSRLELYVKKLDAFVEAFPGHKKRLKAAVTAKEYGLYAECLSDIQKTLAVIHADAIADECQRRLYTLGSMPHEEIDAYTTKFLESVTMLAIDIQMAEYKGEKGEAVIAPKNKVDEICDGILVVDDAQFTLSTMKSFLRETRHKVTCVPSAAAALAFLKNNRPVLFILDIEMPKMNGYELAGVIKASGHQAPIIFLTGSSSHENVLRAAEAGAIDFIVKPVSRKLVLERIGKHIEFIKP
jgi:CheY-like chemotaxis protein